MKRLEALLSAALLLSATPSLARERPVYGPAPDWARYKELGEAALRAKMTDPKARARLAAPGEWTVEWPNGYMEGGWRHKGTFTGYLSCGRIRALTSVAGRLPSVNFVSVIDNDTVKIVDVSGRQNNSLVNVMCDALVRRGYLPPASMMAEPQDQLISSLGIKVRVMPEGAYVSEVTPGSAGQRAGLAPGTVLTRVNGIALAGMGSAMVPLLNSKSPQLVVETATEQRLTLTPAS